jgi:hypothetical protein
MDRLSVCWYVVIRFMRKCLYTNARVEPKDNFKYLKVSIYDIELLQSLEARKKMYDCF